MAHVGQHYMGTSCLCMCHYTKGHECTEHSCRMTGKSEAARVAAQPVTAQAAEPFVGYRTPFGMTTRFGS